MRSVSIIGMGRVGGALALALDRIGYRVKKLFTTKGKNLDEIAGEIEGVSILRSPDDFKAISEEILLITTQDEHIVRVAEDLGSSLGSHDKFVFHTSGSLSSTVLKNLDSLGNNVGSIHPLTSISSPELGVDRLKNAYYCVEGSAEAIPVAEEIIRGLGGTPFTIPTESKPLYHAAAVTACGHLVTLIADATEMLSKCGVEKEKAKQILLPLIKSTVSNIEEQSFGDALTGTFARGDVETLLSHIEALDRGVSDKQLSLYLELGKRSLEIAKERGLDPAKVSKMSRIIKEAQG